MKSEQPSDFGGNCQYSFPACCGMRHSFCRIRSVVFRRSVWTSFFCPCPHLRRCCSAHSPKKEVVAKSYPIQPVIQLEPAFGQQKSRHINVYRPIQKDRLIPCGFWFHNDVTGFEIQSRNCLLRLSVADSSKQFQKRRYFLFAYRRRVRRKVVLLDSVKICNWLCFSLESILLYGRKQVFVNTFKKVFE